jgi:uncharacterized protein (DUF1778 family)
MPRARKPVVRRQPAASPLVVRLGAADKAILAKAARLRRVSVSDYVRTTTLAQAAREVDAARGQTISLSPGEQLAFWKALDEPPVLTPAQKKLGELMRGKR